jgi:hypothetical protein
MNKQDPIVKVIRGSDFKYTNWSNIKALEESYKTFTLLGGKRPRMNKESFDLLQSVETESFEYILNWHHTRFISTEKIDITLDASLAMLLECFCDEEAV